MVIPRNEALATAVASLRDDPTFKLMSKTEQTQEAISALERAGFDVSEDFDAIEEAVTVAAMSPSPVYQPQGVRAHVKKQNPAVQDIPQVPEADDDYTPPAFLTKGQNALKAHPAAPVPDFNPVAVVGRPPKPKPAPTVGPKVYPQGLVAEFKAATGSTDPVIASLVKEPRSTVQAWVVGRTPERLKPEGYRAMVEALDRQAAMIAALREKMR